MDFLIKIITIVGAIDTILLMGAIIWAVTLWIRGISPALYRLGYGLARRKIAVFAKNDNLNSIKALLTDSKLFRAKNIEDITRLADIERADKASVYLVYWSDWSDNITEILQKKPSSCALIIYAPYNEGRIPDEKMVELDGKRHTAVTNFRGRLLNDIVTSMITTSYEKK